MTGDSLAIKEAALFAYRFHYDALSEHLDLSDEEMSRIFGQLDIQMARSVSPEGTIDIQVNLREETRE